MKQHSCPFAFLPERRRGFTLVEMAIVLVVIGLIVGGVLVGRDLIKASEIRAQVKQISQVNSAVLAFKLKYNCLPGDCAQATQYFTGGSQPTQVTNGNGNGSISGYWGLPPETAGTNGVWLHVGSSANEWAYVFDSLAAAGMYEIGQYDETNTSIMNYPGVGYPQLKVNSPGGSSPPGGLIVGYEPGAAYVAEGHKLRLGGCHNGDYINWVCGLNQSEAQALDERIDDGKPYSGRMVIMGGTSTYAYRLPVAAFPSSADDETSTCGNYAVNRYLRDGYTIFGPSSGAYRGCSMSLKADF